LDPEISISPDKDIPPFIFNFCKRIYPILILGKQF
jgi:hypothetical protein